ncbi:MAG: hypothetical protein J6Y04_03620 [Bacteroidaceae bacterium]|nr:hypothetical protein [Bacteroidaceae bacterium]
MSTASYIILGWLAFDVIVYLYLIYDIHAPRINFRQRMRQLRDAFTEEE